MSAEPHHERRPAWRVVRAIASELKRQGVAHGLVDPEGRIALSGITTAVDLAALAHITEMALRQEFGV